MQHVSLFFLLKASYWTIKQKKDILQKCTIYSSSPSVYLLAFVWKWECNGEEAVSVVWSDPSLLTEAKTRRALVFLGLWQTDREEAAEGHQDKLRLGLFFLNQCNTLQSAPLTILSILTGGQITFFCCAGICCITWSHTVGFFAPTLLVLPPFLPSVSVVFFAVSIGLINQAAWQVNVRNGWVSVWRGRRVVCRCICVCVCVRVARGKREPAVAQHLVAHGWVSKDNCRYQPVPISLMWTCGIMETALSQRREIERREEEIDASEEFGKKIWWTGLIWGSAPKIPDSFCWNPQCRIENLINSIWHRHHFDLQGYTVKRKTWI